jgi:protein-tyrosine kinase
LASAAAATLAFACALSTFAPREYVATGGVLLPGGMQKVRYTASDPGTAAGLVERFIRKHDKPLLVDPPLVVASRPLLRTNLAWAAAFVFLLFAWIFLRLRKPLSRSEAELTTALGPALLAARPLAVQSLTHQLLAHWFKPGRAVLAVVSPEKGDGRTRLAAELARAFAGMGEPTLVIDADLRSPQLHRAFGLSNRAGLADFLEGRSVRLEQCADNLAVLVAGRAGGDPLELLSRERMLEFLAAAAQRYRVVLVDTPAAARGPDLQLFAAFAGGALVVTRRPTGTKALERLREFLAGAKARVVGTVLNPV